MSSLLTDEGWKMTKEEKEAIGREITDFLEVLGKAHGVRFLASIGIVSPDGTQAYTFAVSWSSLNFSMLDVTDIWEDAIITAAQKAHVCSSN